MGGCFSDVRGGKEAVGRGAQHPAFQGSAAASSSGTADVNEAVDMFLQSRGLGGLYAQLELSLSASKLCNLDYLSEMLKLNEQEFLGEASCTLSEEISWLMIKKSRLMSHCSGSS